MIKRNLLRITLLLALVLCLSAVVTLTSCGDKVTDIYVASENSPRLTYVQGQELDLEDGILTVVIDGEEAKVALNSEDVKISGYDRDKLGEQVLTIEYEELTTSITVTVIPRITAEGYEMNYFKGDTFDNSKGKLQVATDSGTTYTVNMSDERVKLVSFNASNTGTSAVTVSFTNDGKTYECTFDVTVYDHSKVSFTPPSKIDYLSHEKVIDVTDGFFTVVSSDNKLTKYVPLKADMVKGFNTSAATMANRESPLTQLLSVEYLTGKSFTFEISITYSGVSVVNHYATGVLSEINWPDNSDLTDIITVEQAEAAIDAINAYYLLGDNEKKLISTENKQIVARAATVVANSNFYKELQTYSGTFSVDEKLSVYLTAKDFSVVESDSARLMDPNTELRVVAKLLRRLEEDFSDVIVVEDTTVEEYINIYSESVQSYVFDIITHMVAVYTPLKDIPENWTVDDLKEFGPDIISATLQIKGAGHYSSGGGGFYKDVISKYWRKNDDLFEIIYSYFLYVHDDGVTFMIDNKMLGTVPLPDLVEDWYDCLNSAISVLSNYSKNFNKTALLADVSEYMYYYFSTLEGAKTIKASENKLAIDVYNAYNGDETAKVYTYGYSYSEFGYLHHAGAMVDSDTFSKLWNSFYELLKLYQDDKLSADEHKSELTAMIDLFMAQTPAELFGFLSSLNLLYSNVDRDESPDYYSLEFDENSAENMFTVIIRDFYLDYISEDGKPLVSKLLVAMECYSLIGHKKSALDDFKAAMLEFTTEFNKMSDPDKENFKQYFGKSYDRYVKLYTVHTESVSLALTAEEEALMAELLLRINRYYTVYNIMSGYDDKNMPQELYGLLFSTYAGVIKTYEKLVGVATDDALTYLFTEEYTMLDENVCTLELAFFIVDNTTTSILTRNSASISTSGGASIRVTAWDLFHDYGTFDVIADVYELIYYYNVNKEGITLTDAYVQSIMSAVCDLERLGHQILNHLNIDLTYYDAIDEYLDTKLSADGAAVAEKLIAAAKAYVNFTEENQTEFKSLMASVATSFESLTDSDKAFLDAMYNKYIKAYNDMKNPA